MRRLLTVAVLAVLAGCSTPTPYQPLTDGFGYSDQLLEQNRFRVTFSGNSDTPRSTVENYLLYRAAEVTVKSGFDYFVIADRETEPTRTYISSFDGYPGFGYYRYSPGWYGYDGLGMGMGMGMATTTAITSYQAYADIVMFSGNKPATNVHAFNAREVMNALGPSIVRPQPGG